MKRRQLLTGMAATGLGAMVLPAPMVLAQSPRVLRVTSFLPWDDVNMTAFRAFVETVNERTEGALELRWIGGPEAVPAFNQFDALQEGVVDVIFSAESYYGQGITGAPYTHLTRRTPSEERENGYVDFRRELMAPHGARYLGRGEFGPWFHVFTNNRISKLDDFAGQRIRVSGTYGVFMEALGAAPITMPGSEIYTALDRGAIDGYAWSVLGNMSMSWHEVVRYIVPPRLFNMNIETLINAETFAALDPALQTLLDEVMAENEVDYTPIMTEIAQREHDEMVAAGLEPVELSQADTERYLELAYQSQWQLVEDAGDPAVVSRLREFFG